MLVKSISLRYVLSSLSQDAENMTMAMSWKLLKQLRAPYTATSTSLHRIVSPRLLNFHNANRLFSAAPSPSGEPSLIPPPRFPSPSSKIQAELAKFCAIAQTWWDAGGPIKYFHRHRVDFVRSMLCHHFRRDPLSARPFEGLKFIDVGCGSGILSEPLVRMGATVTGVDPVEKKIKIARLHADLDPVTSRIEYHCTTAEKLVKEQKSFDAVLALGVIQHVSNPDEFCKSLSALIVPDGAIMISATAANPIVMIASFLLHWLPNGTPQWLSVVYPHNLVQFMERASISPGPISIDIPRFRRANFVCFGTKTKTPEQRSEYHIGLD